ncbi:ABC transporter ATP-binding protein [Lentilactobacillus diolivorans]|uniref:ABC transporter ATP-binding protein n=1 Tax=Lentilactobacillus diolivorans TaxID=179838 RepID=UPI0024690980|nr:ABC transporter ATP-binding protein [Lentilactobacillus diolivorans]MDH5105498.1 ABC transporter ATP-binding protein [Lentilactobacillus diolivorans]
MTTTILTIDHVSKHFGHFQALNDVTFSINRGDIYGLIGENGAGKTTLMRLITHLSPLADGKITLLGESATHYQQALKHVGAVIETPAAFKKLTVRQNLKLTAIQHGIQDKHLIDQTIDFVGLSAKQKTKASHLSLGQRQRLGLALALLPQPDFLILDEPINGLDPSGIVAFRKLLKQLNQERNTTILISSHILTELYQVSTKFGFIHHGKFIKEVTKETLDKENESGILLGVSDVKLAAQLLDNDNIGSFTVLNDHQILIHNFSIDTAKLNQTLVTNGVAVTNITRQEGSLEQYYTNLLQHQGGDQQ